jgi:RNA polymerase sigma-70 factor (TIGR02957 family)
MPLNMDEATSTFNSLRPRLQAIAYRMLGSVAEAEEIVQDVWLKWHGQPRDEVDNAEAWLVSVATRTSIDRLRAARVEREHYQGIWLPEPLVSGSPPTPEELLEKADQVSLGLLRLMERLTPESRAAFLLREVFDVDYPDLARLVGKTEAACRQLVRRAKAQLEEGRTRYTVPAEKHGNLVTRFAEAMTGGNFAALKDLLAEDAVLEGDGGGKVTSFPKPLVGGQRIAQLFYASQRRHGQNLRIELARINGAWGLLRFIDGQLESAQSYETDGTRIVAILVQRNPDKLKRIAASLRS